MTNVYSCKVVIASMMVLLYLSLVSYLNGAEKEEIRARAENFVIQICNKNSLDTILQSHQMTDEFYKAVSDNSNIVKWATEIDRIFGQLGNVVNAKVVDHGKDIRSVDLYYKGTKRPAIMRVTFAGTDIGGLHFSLWVDAGKEEIRTIAENFVRQICNKNSSNAILQSYKMTDEFYTLVSDGSNIVKWSTAIDRIFGQLGNVVDSKIVDHGKDLRSVNLYYKGTKRPAIMRVTFAGTNIGGLHFSLWVDGYDKNTFLQPQKWGSLSWSLFAAYCFIYSFSCIFFGEWIRKRYVQRLRSEYQYRDEHLLSSYTESQNPSWCFILFHGLALSFITIPCLVFLTTIIFYITNIDLFNIIMVLALVIIFLELLPLLVVGFFIEVDDQYLTVRMGKFRLRVLRLELNDILSVEIVKFRPIRDFSGWGIRMRRNGWAYFMSGTEGVQITTTKQRQYLIGSDIPDRLAKVILGKIHGIEHDKHDIAE
ncbi:MAG: hypothetical protein LBL39_00115 [Planctomycetaceae bacterium]|jgi:hypothetical protein|nr:hypothetical protein [Planctomycetaceae bacterium]